MNRDTLGEVVRDAWIRWAKTQPDIHESRLIDYDQLSDSLKEKDRQIGEAVEFYVKNQRRHVLCGLKSRDELTERETAEFETLQQECFEWINKVFPGPASALPQLDAIMAKIQASESTYEVQVSEQGDTEKSSE